MKGKKQKEPVGFNPAEIFAALALLEQERTGALRVVRWAERSDASRAWTVRDEKETIIEHGLLREDSAFARYMREKYPESWELARQQEKET